MTDSPAAASPYEVLGVEASASMDDLRRAYRRLARETHPDLGGTSAGFLAVQLAWERIGTPDDRARFDRAATAGRATAGRSSSSDTAGGDGQGSGEPSGSSRWAPAPPRKPDSKPRARTYGHPGGRAREVYLGLMREWVGRGEPLDDPYDAALVRSAPREIRRCLAEALAEEATAAIVADLGMAYTMWSDVEAGVDKLDHVVLAPTGVFAVRSDDLGRAVRVVRGDIESEGLAPGEQPIRSMIRSARALTKQTRVPFDAMLMVVPDEALDEAVVPFGAGRRNTGFVVRRSVLAHILRGGLRGGDSPVVVDVFEIRSRLHESIRFV